MIKREEVLKGNIESGLLHIDPLGQMSWQSVAKSDVLDAEVGHVQHVPVVRYHVEDATSGAVCGTRIESVIIGWYGGCRTIRIRYVVRVIPEVSRDSLGHGSIRCIKAREGHRRGSEHVAFADSLKEDREIKSLPVRINPEAIFVAWGCVADDSKIAVVVR